MSRQAPAAHFQGELAAAVQHDVSELRCLELTAPIGCVGLWRAVAVEGFTAHDRVLWNPGNMIAKSCKI